MQFFTYKSLPPVLRTQATTKATAEPVLGCGHGHFPTIEQLRGTLT
jgi:hypothetical protein